MRKVLIIVVLIVGFSSYGRTAEDYFNSTDSKYKLKDFEGAIADYLKAIELKPKLSEAYNNRGISKIKLNKKNSGYLDLSKASELGFRPANDSLKKYCD